MPKAHKNRKDLLRFGIAVEQELLIKFDRIRRKRGCDNRSEAIRDLLRNFILEHQWSAGGEGVGIICYHYDHHVPRLLEKITEAQHHHPGIISTLHVHLNHHQCMELIVLKGKRTQIDKLATRIFTLKGVTYGKTVMLGAEL